MIEVKYGEIPEELFSNYLEFLIGRFFKIIPMEENNQETLKDYLLSLQRELIGNSELIKDLKFDGNFIILLNTLEYFIVNKNIEHSIYRKEIFKCMSIIKKLQEQYKRRGDN